MTAVQMIIDCVSDLHGELPTLQGGDLLILAGDCTASDKMFQWVRFFEWLSQQRYRKKVMVAGNHDGLLTKGFPEGQTESTQLKKLQEWLVKIGEIDAPEFEYLCDSGTEFEGLKIWGSPWTPKFGNWHFMLPRNDEIKAKWDLIPNDTDILITHGPSLGILDKVKSRSNSVLRSDLGCEHLREAVERVKPGLHVFGHIHGGYGTEVLKHDDTTTLCVNASFMNDYYEPVNDPIRVNYSSSRREFRACGISDR